jgi:hypothetical protein
MILKQLGNLQTHILAQKQSRNLHKLTKIKISTSERH